MSKAEEAIEAESARKSVEARTEPNGLIMAVHRPADDLGLTLEVDTDLAMEVDDEYRESADEQEILWHRQLHDSSSTYPSLAPHRRSLRQFAVDAVSISGSTRSLYDSDLDYYIENNRRYVSDYWQPNDEEEQLRMQIMHQVFLFLLKSQLTSVPLTNPTRILDIGTGTGDWAIGIGEAFPDAEVIGTDLSAIQPSAVPPRVFFEIFNVEDEDDWTYPQDHFDLIHFRNMAGSFQSWDRMYGRAFAHLKPGGWIEVVDFDDQTNTFAKFFKEKSEMYNWYMALREAVILSGKEAGAAHLDPQRLSACGFVEVKVSRHELPVGVWPEEPDARSTAKLWLVACLAGFESVSLRLLTRHLRWEPDEVLRVCRNMEATLKSLAMDKEKAKGLSASVKILIGRKPIHSEDTGHQSDDLEAALEVDDAQPEGKRVKRDSTLKRREEQELSNVASAANPETEPETSKHDGNDSMMNEQL